MSMKTFEEQQAAIETLELMGIDWRGIDDTVFGEGVFVHCDAHGAVHVTGWCTVMNLDKTILETKNEGEGSYQAAGQECRDKGLWLYNDHESRS